MPASTTGIAEFQLSERPVSWLSLLLRLMIPARTTPNTSDAASVNTMIWPELFLRRILKFMLFPNYDLGRLHGGRAGPEPKKLARANPAYLNHFATLGCGRRRIVVVAFAFEASLKQIEPDIIA